MAPMVPFPLTKPPDHGRMVGIAGPGEDERKTMRFCFRYTRKYPVFRKREQSLPGCVLTGSGGKSGSRHAPRREDARIVPFRRPGTPSPGWDADG